MRSLTNLHRRGKWTLLRIASRPTSKSTFEMSGILRRTSVIVAAAVAVILTIFGCVSNQPPSAQAPKAGKPLVKSLPAGIQGVELVDGIVRVKPGYQWVKQPNGTVTVARMGGGGLGASGVWDCTCIYGGGNCIISVTTSFLRCQSFTCESFCWLTVTTIGVRTPIIAY